MFPLPFASFRQVFLATVAALALGGVAAAATQSITANVAFETPLSLVADSQISFGLLQASTSGTYVIDTNGLVTASGGGVVLGGTKASGQVTISGSVTQTVVISTGSYAASAGVTPSAATCNYDGSTIANCDAGGAGLAAPGSGKVLKLGVTIVTDGSQQAGATATPSFVVSVVYG